MTDDTAVLPTVPPGPPVPPVEDDNLAAELAKAAPRRWWNRVTIVLGAGALLLGGFVGGLQVPTDTEAAAPAAANPFAGGGGGPRNFPGGGGPPSAAPAAAGAATTTGKVKLVDGATIYVETSDGTVVTVRTGDDTKVRKTAAAKLKDLAAGDTISVQGAADAEGTVTATAVTKESR